MKKSALIFGLCGLLLAFVPNCGNNQTPDINQPSQSKPADTDHTDVDHTDIDNTDIDHTDIDHTDIDHTDIDHTDIDHTDIDHTDIDHTDVDHTDVDHTDVDHTDVDHTDDDPYIGEMSFTEESARHLIDGLFNANDVFRVISHADGFPVLTRNKTVIFMHLYKGGNWSVAGDFNNWQPQPMINKGDFWYLEVPMPSSDKLFYKFVNNGTDYIADPYAQNYTYDENGEISYIKAPTGTAYLKRWPNVMSPQGLLERTIRAYIPAGKAPFDVIYAHDGQNLFQTDGYWGGWKLHEALAKVSNRIAVIAIDNTNDRMNEYTHVNDLAFDTYYKTKGKQYAEFVNNTVRPFVEARINLTSKRAVMGSSLGGLISLYIALLYPGEYKMVLALSPSTAWGRFGSDTGTTIEDLYVEAGHQNTVLYLDNGGYVPSDNCSGKMGQEMAYRDESEGADALDNYCFTRHFVDTMANSLNYTWDKDLFHQYVPGAKHNEAAWAQRVDYPIKIFNDLN